MGSGTRRLRVWLGRKADVIGINPIERKIGGRTGGVLYVVAGLTAIAYALLPRPAREQAAVLLAVAGMSIAWGVVSLWVIDWRRANPYIAHLSSQSAILAVVVAMAATGGSRSMLWIYLFWQALYSSYFYSRPVAVFYLAACVCAQALPLAYDPHAVGNGYLAELIVSAAGYVALGASVATGKHRVEGLRVRAETLAAEQGALQRAVTALIRGEQADHIFQLVSADLGVLVGADAASVLRLTGEREATVLGSWVGESSRWFSSGETVNYLPDGGVSTAIAARRVVRTNNLSPSSSARVLGHSSTIIAPIMIEAQPWGVIAVASMDMQAFTKADEQRVELFAETLARVIQTVEERARLEAAALTDQLTGLPNHRALHQRLATELMAAERKRTPLSVAMLDVDNFKEINDRHGHAAGDAALRFVADCMRQAVRGSDVVGRLGGDEFMWILPDTERNAALRAVERARELIGQGDGTGEMPTTSVGICDTSGTIDPAELVRRADVALYASKAHGRNQVTLYDTDVAAALDVDARDAWFERSQALAGLRALARAIDARDPVTAEHSQRVADFVGLLAQADGWSEDRVARLRDAALVHDVGKLGVPDALLTKPGKLTEPERAQMNTHVELSARIVGNILSDEQVAWIRAHHERPDGRGYPRGLPEEEISDGAGLLALADAWDVMVVGRSYSRPKSLGEAYQECLEMAGRHFTERAVRALRKLHDEGWFERGERWAQTQQDSSPLAAALASADGS